MEFQGAEALKRQAAARALEYVESGMALGLGTGSTVAHFLDLLGDALRSGALHSIIGVPTSLRTTTAATDLGIPLSTLAAQPELDLCVDGADEVSPELDLIKGMGGALLREKMVAQASARLVIMADDTKVVERLGSASALPVEVVAWGHEVHVRRLESEGARVELRSILDGSPYLTDNGNVVLDCSFEGGIADPQRLDANLKSRAGIVETGLFLGMTECAVIAGAGGVHVMERPS
jgi:ribose 5-phosphate isomerase A